MRRIAIAVLMVCAVFFGGASAAHAGARQADAARRYAQIAAALHPSEGNYVVKDFRFHNGQTLPSLRLHYTTLGHPRRNSAGQVTNAVLLLHATGATGHQFLAPPFAGVLFGPGELLDARRYFIILPDEIGHGRSSKPSDGLRMNFPRYDYADMVRAQHLLVTRGLDVNHLHLVGGTSMGCMHTWLWTEEYPGFMDAALPFACMPVPIAGRNWIARQMVIDDIREDPAWDNGDYTKEPESGLRGALGMIFFLLSAPLHDHQIYPTREAATRFAREFVKDRLPHLDANDMIYQWDASRDYNPEPRLGEVRAWVTAINTADDQIDPVVLVGIERREIRKVKRGRFVLLPVSDGTVGHATYNHPAVWKQYLAQLLRESSR
ncbi:MAG TPA: alpha/beta fold hydrolase [Candidatus Dormibacteraeota bacterium]|nr:alpha/beta fold hydrolase [Candidatus Dormibacteraeota bacterium]